MGQRSEIVSLFWTETELVSWDSVRVSDSYQWARRFLSILRVRATEAHVQFLLLFMYERKREQKKCYKLINVEVWSGDIFLSRLCPWNAWTKSTPVTLKRRHFHFCSLLWSESGLVCTEQVQYVLHTQHWTDFRPRQCERLLHSLQQVTSSHWPTPAAVWPYLWLRTCDCSQVWGGLW